MALLDQPSMREIRDRFLGSYDMLAAVNAAVDEATHRLLATQTGGDTFCYWMLYHFDLDASIAQNFAVIRNGEYPLYDVRIRILNMDTNKDVHLEAWGELNSPADVRFVRWELPSDIYYRLLHVRNGSWNQDLQLSRSEKARCWLAATRVLDRTGAEVFRHVDSEFEPEFGDPMWRAVKSRGAARCTIMPGRRSRLADLSDRQWIAGMKPDVTSQRVRITGGRSALAADTPNRAKCAQ